MQDIEVETMPGVILGHKNIPVQQSPFPQIVLRDFTFFPCGGLPSLLF